MRSSERENKKKHFFFRFFIFISLPYIKKSCIIVKIPVANTPWRFDSLAGKTILILRTFARSSIGGTMKQKNSSAHTVALLGVMAAVLVTVLFLESAIFKIFAYTPPAFLSLGILMALCLSWDWKHAFLFSVVFGVTSLLCALFIGNPYFLMPWVSILPRLFVGPCAYGAFCLKNKLTAKSEKEFLKDTLPIGVGAAAGILTNTVLVITALFVFFPASVEGGFGLGDWISLCISINFPIELVCAVVLAPILTRVIKKVMKQG